MNVATLDYVDLLGLSAKLAGLDPDQVAADEFSTFRLLHADRLNEIWDFRPWACIKLTEKRYFRPLYTNSVYAAGAEVYYPGARKYYQALRAVIAGQAPATLVGTTWTTNLSYWAESMNYWGQNSTSYGGSEYVATTAYVQGNVVFYSLTDQYYQLYAATSTGNAPSDATKWGALTPFNRYVAYEQSGFNAFDQALSAWSSDPRNDAGAQRLDCFLSSDGAQILQGVAFVWLVYKLRCPNLSGDVLNAASAYVVGQQVYYASTITRGNFYNCIVNAAPGETPDTAAAKWAVVEIPADWQTYLAHGAAADYALPNGDVMVRDRENRRADDELEGLAMAHDALVSDQVQSNVLTR